MWLLFFRHFSDKNEWQLYILCKRDCERKENGDDEVTSATLKQTFNVHLLLVMSTNKSMLPLIDSLPSIIIIIVNLKIAHWLIFNAWTIRGWIMSPGSHSFQYIYHQRQKGFAVIDRCINDSDTAKKKF